MIKRVDVVDVAVLRVADGVNGSKRCGSPEGVVPHPFRCVEAMKCCIRRDRFPGVWVVPYEYARCADSAPRVQVSSGQVGRRSRGLASCPPLSINILLSRHDVGRFQEALLVAIDRSGDGPVLFAGAC